MRDPEYWTPGKVLVAIVFVALAIVGISLVVVYAEEGNSAAPDVSRYKTEHNESWGSAAIWVLIEKKTGKRFLFVQNGYGAGLTEITKDEPVEVKNGE